MYIVIFASPKYCEKMGVPLRWHPHRLFDTLAEADACAATLETNPFFMVRIHKLSVPKRDQPRTRSGRFVREESARGWEAP